MELCGGVLMGSEVTSGLKGSGSPGGCDIGNTAEQQTLSALVCRGPGSSLMRLPKQGAIPSGVH